MRKAHRLALCLVPVFGLLGCLKNSLAFSTATKFGLDISQRADQTIDVSMGYDRAEIVSIPAPANRDAAEHEDTYSVLGYFHVSYGNPWTDKPLVIRQVFSTGLAAREASKNTALQGFFAGKAAEPLTRTPEVQR